MRGGRRSVALAGSVLVVSSLVACSSPAAEPRRTDGTDHGTDDRAALVSAINDQVDLDPRHDNLRALVVLQAGRPVLERYYDWPADSYWDVGWLTTTILSTLVGIAVEEGEIPGLDAPLSRLLPDHAAEMRPEVADTTLREVLTMRGGFAGTDRDRVLGLIGSADPLGGILDGATDPGSRYFDYSQQGAHVLAAVLAEATGGSVLDYARSRLFDPLGIDTRPAYQPLAGPSATARYRAADFAWPVDSTGLNLGWARLKLRPGDLARIGELFLERGEWRGRQLVPLDWVREATSPQANDVARYGGAVNARGYGYGWWTTEADSEPAYFAADGSGQLLEVVPSRSLVVVVASENQYTPTGSGLSPTSLTFLVNDVIAPYLADDRAGG